jgi:hypothetical protein
MGKELEQSRIFSQKSESTFHQAFSERLSDKEKNASLFAGGIPDLGVDVPDNVKKFFQDNPLPGLEGFEYYDVPTIYVYALLVKTMDREVGKFILHNLEGEPAIMRFKKGEDTKIIKPGTAIDIYGNFSKDHSQIINELVGDRDDELNKSLTLAAILPFLHK